MGGPGYNGPYSGLPSADPTVDVSTETLLSLWDAGARDTALCQPHETPLRGKWRQYRNKLAARAVVKLEFFHLEFTSSLDADDGFFGLCRDAECPPPSLWQSTSTAIKGFLGSFICAVGLAYVTEMKWQPSDSQWSPVVLLCIREARVIHI